MTSCRAEMRFPHPTDSVARRVVLFLISLGLCGNACLGDEKPASQGKMIYQSRCASCHGKSGQGVAKKYEKPLAINASLAELTELISETMPEEDPDACVGKEASAVANYILQAFQGNTSPPRIRLARLTAGQLQQSLADLYGHFGNFHKFDQPQGLQGEYFEGSKPRRDKRKFERVDATIDFDFEDQGPGQGVNAKDFSIQWSGGLEPGETGRYELILRSTCAFVCYWGSYDRELINNYVQSGDKTEFRRTIALTAGRVYPFKIQFHQRKRKTKQPPAKISLSWIPPGGTERIVPARNLVAEQVPAAFALQAKLPPDDRSYGYE
ncbi:MAG: PA14 domain-containing protein, partial [Planctomycetales bacterium]